MPSKKASGKKYRTLEESRKRKAALAARGIGTAKPKSNFDIAADILFGKKKGR